MSDSTPIQYNPPFLTLLGTLLPFFDNFQQMYGLFGPFCNFCIFFLLFYNFLFYCCWLYFFNALWSFLSIFFHFWTLSIQKVTCTMSHAMCHILCVMCHVSCVSCHLSPGIRHVSCVLCHMSPVSCHLLQSRLVCFRWQKKKQRKKIIKKFIKNRTNLKLCGYRPVLAIRLWPEVSSPQLETFPGGACVRSGVVRFTRRKLGLLRSAQKAPQNAPKIFNTLGKRSKKKSKCKLFQKGGGGGTPKFTCK